jgi:hypothetical protein
VALTVITLAVPVAGMPVVVAGLGAGDGDAGLGIGDGAGVGVIWGAAVPSDIENNTRRTVAVRAFSVFSMVLVSSVGWD